MLVGHRAQTLLARDRDTEWLDDHGPHVIYHRGWQISGCCRPSMNGHLAFYAFYKVCTSGVHPGSDAPLCGINALLS